MQEAQGPSSPSRARHEGAWLASKGLGAAGDHVMDVAGTGYRVQGKGLGAAGDHVMDVAAASVSSAASARDGVTAAASVSSAATGPRPTYDETTPYVADGYARGEMAGGGGVGLEDGRAAFSLLGHHAMTERGWRLSRLMTHIQSRRRLPLH